MQTSLASLAQDETRKTFLKRNGTASDEFLKLDRQPTGLMCHHPNSAAGE
jgi:hypothetical protein